MPAQTPSPPVTTPPPSNGATRLPPAAQAPRRGRMHTRISGLRTGLIVGVAVLVVVLIFIIQNTHAVNISFLGAHLRLSLAVALLLAAIAGALLMAAAGTARITQLRLALRRTRRRHPAAPAPPGR
jgi:lipopolysaccharide assembly protein A